MRRSTPILLVLALVVVAVLWFFLGREEGGDGAPIVERAAPAVAPPVEPAALTEVADARAPRVSVPVEPGEVPVAAETPGASATDGLAEVRGRLLRPDGAPASGAAIHLRGWAGNQERTLKFGAPADWKDPTTTSGADGRFSLRLDPPRAFQFVLECELAGHAKASWRWNELEPAQVRDVGDVTFAASGTVRARIVDAQGRALVQGWRIHADGSGADLRSERQATRVSAAVDASGSALLEGLPPGPAKLQGYSRIANWIEGPVVEVRAGEVVDAEVRYDGPDNSRRIVVVAFSRPFHVFSHDVEGITLSGPGLEPRTAKRLEGSSQSYGFEDLEPDRRYSVQVDDPRFRPWRADDVAPGTSVDAKLSGNAAVQLSVVDAATLAPVERYEVDVRFDGARFGPNVFRLLERTAEPPAGGLFDALVPFDQTLIVRADGYATCEVAAPKLAANETRALVARLTRGATVAGLVVERETRTPRPGVEVFLRPAVASMYGRAGDDPQSRSTRSDAAGRFAFEGVGDATWRVEAAVSPTVRALREVVVADGRAADATLELPQSGLVAGRLIAPAGASFEGLRVLVAPRERDESDLLGLADDAAAPIAADGTFRTEPVRVGKVDVSLQMPQVRIPSGFSGWSGHDGGSIALEELELAPGENRREYDVRDRFPGSIRVVAHVDGAPAAGIVVQAVSKETSNAAASTTLDAEGKGVLQPLAPGSYELVAHPVEGSWRHRDGRLVAVASNESPAIALDVRLAEGTLLLVDAAGVPLARTKVGLGSAGAQWSEMQVETDADGRVRRKLALGRYEVWGGDGMFAGVRGPAFEWTTKGPVPDRLVVPKP